MRSRPSALRQSEAVVEQLNAVMTAVRDAETSQRGFLLTGEERYLAPYAGAKAALPAALEALRRMLPAGSPQAEPPRARWRREAAQKIAELDRTIALHRAGRHAPARWPSCAPTRDRRRWSGSGPPSPTMEARGAARAGRPAGRMAARPSRPPTASRGAARRCSSLLIGMAAVLMSRDYRARETQIWLRTGQTGLSARLQGEQRLETLGEHVLGFLAAVPRRAGRRRLHRRRRRPLPPLRRLRASPPDAPASAVRAGDGLLGQVARGNRGRARRPTCRPATSPCRRASGRAHAAQLLIAPASVDGVVQAVVELGFFRDVTARRARAARARVSESLGVAVRASKDRTRLEELLEETQRQAEELQTQQEELRVSNEELEEQSRALKESQARLETQQAELEQTNAQLEEQTQLLEQQKDDAGARRRRR